MKKEKYNYLDKISVAPMLNYTDKHCRFFYRSLTKKTLLYTEMITTQEILYKKNSARKFYEGIYNPIAIQLSGNNPEELSKCAKLAYLQGYDEINLNVGCPSKNAKNGNFGIYLMMQPKLVFKIIKLIYKSVPIPISIKIRLGTNKKNDYFFLKKFIETISEKNFCNKFIIHARIADLNLSNTKKNRTIPPLNYSYVYQIKKDFPYLKIIINGGINSISEIKEHLKKTDGVMLGRSIYKNPFILTKIASEILNENSIINIKKKIIQLVNYIEKEIKKGILAINILKHILNIFYGYPNSKKWKKYILDKIKDSKNLHNTFQNSFKIIEKKNKKDEIKI